MRIILCECQASTTTRNETMVYETEGVVRHGIPQTLSYDKV